MYAGGEAGLLFLQRSQKTGKAYQIRPKAVTRQMREVRKHRKSPRTGRPEYSDGRISGLRLVTVESLQSEKKPASRTTPHMATDVDDAAESIMQYLDKASWAVFAQCAPLLQRVVDITASEIS